MLDEYAEDLGLTPEKNNPIPGARKPLGVSSANAHDRLTPLQKLMQQTSDQQAIFANKPKPLPGMERPAPVQKKQEVENPEQMIINDNHTRNRGVVRDRLGGIFSEESPELNELLSRSGKESVRNNVLFVFVCIIIVVVSFWLSYALGVKFLVPGGGHKDYWPNYPKRTINKLKRVWRSNLDVVRPEVKKRQRSMVPSEVMTPALPPEILNQPQVTLLPLVPAEPTFPGKPAPVKKVVAPPKAAKASGQKMYRVVVGAFDTKAQGEDIIRNIKADGFPVFMALDEGKYRIQIGSFRDKNRAIKVMKKASDYGYNAYLSIK